ncbi:hypothetical protein JOM56_009464 [Amanita muscaria]
MSSVSNTLSKAEKKALHEALDKIKVNDLVDLAWELQYATVHGVGTSQLGGYKLGSMRGTDAQYRVGIFRTAKKKLIPPPVVSAAWAAVPTGQEILDDLNTAIDA